MHPKHNGNNSHKDIKSENKNPAPIKKQDTPKPHYLSDFLNIDEIYRKFSSKIDKNNSKIIVQYANGVSAPHPLHIYGKEIDIDTSTRLLRCDFILKNGKSLAIYITEEGHIKYEVGNSKDAKKDREMGILENIISALHR